MSGSTTRTVIARLASQEGLCVYCDVNLTEKNATLDHVIPRSWGGNPSGVMNTVLACEQCNSFKSGLESHITNQMGAHLGLVERAALFALRCMKRPNKSTLRNRLRFSRMAEHVIAASDQHHQQNHNVILGNHREKYL